MSRIARSSKPAYLTRGRPVYAALQIELADGSPADLIGSSATAALRWAGSDRTLAVAPFDASGVITATGPTSLTSDLPLGRVSEIAVALTDSQGGNRASSGAVNLKIVLA